MVYIYCVCVSYVRNLESTWKILQSPLEKGNGCLGKVAMEKPGLVIDEENSCRFEIPRKEHWVHT